MFWLNTSRLLIETVSDRQSCDGRKPSAHVRPKMNNSKKTVFLVPLVSDGNTIADLRRFSGVLCRDDDDDTDMAIEGGDFPSVNIIKPEFIGCSGF